MPAYIGKLEEKTKEVEVNLKAFVEDKLKLETDKLFKGLKELDEKLDLIRIQFIKTKRNESDLKNE